MHCFTHPETAALAVCKYCFKAVCAACHRDSPAGSSCSAQCEKEVEEGHQMMTKAKKLYGIGAGQKKISNAVAMYLFFGAGFWGLGLFTTLRQGAFDWTGASIGTLFFVFALFVFYSEKKSGVKC
ncbi:MAG: hypothetical protein IT560_08915 [Alphaproteobacteria bacterium]|nr:hypothetical protein [Alphaproteobacteria bacterium]